MYEWLDEELSRIKTPKFHIVEGPASKELRQAIKSCDYPLPKSYKEFALRFGNAKLYRRTTYWLIEVYAGPREAKSNKGDRLIQFGRSHTSLAYFKESLLLDSGESPVYEWRHGQSLRATGAGFPDWLKHKCNWARSHYKREEWKAIEDGPSPFSKKEQAIVEARRLFHWRVVGVTSNDDVRFEIHNDSKMTLRYLSIGIRGKLRPPESGPLTGGGYLPVGSIRPGGTGFVEYDCYKKYIAPEDTDVFALPDPGPEDREVYWEFKTLN